MHSIHIHNIMDENSSSSGSGGNGVIDDGGDDNGSGSGEKLFYFSAFYSQLQLYSFC